MTDRIIKTFHVLGHGLQDYVHAIIGAGSGIFLLTLQTIQDQLLNSLFSIITSAIIVTISYFLTRYYKKKFPPDRGVAEGRGVKK